MRVYKFVSAKWAKEAILTHQLKISLLNTLNDPWDGNALSFDSDDQRAAWGRTQNQLSQKHGIICFSSDWCDPVLWSHYADQHHGLALGFDVSDSLTMQVEYRNDLIQFGEFYSLTAQLDKEEFFKRVISTKYTNWKYEEEVRIFIGLDEPNPQMGHFFKKFDTELTLRSVIFGSRYNNHEEMAVVLSHIRKDTSIDCWRAALGEKTFKMRVDPNWTYQRT